MINNIIKILNLKYYDIDLEKSYLDDVEQRDFKLHIFFNKRDVLCPICNTKGKLKEYKIKNIIHSIFIDAKCIIVLHQRRMYCPECGKTFMENNPLVFKGHKADIDTELSILNRLRNYRYTFKDVAETYHISTTTVVRIFDNRVNLKRHSLSKWVSMDEFYARKLTKTGYCLVLFDPIHNKIIDILDSRHKKVIIDYFSRIPIEERKKVQFISIDMWESYKEAALLAFPNCIIAVDSFHVMKHLTQAIDKARIRIMNDFKENEKDDIGYYRLLKKFHYFLTTNIENIKFKPRKESKYQYLIDKYGMLEKLLSISPELRKIYNLRELYREFNSVTEYPEAQEKLQDVIDKFKTAGIEELWPFISLLENWFTEICNSFMIIENKRLSNGPIESLNSRVKIVLNNGYGYTNFRRFRNRLMYSLNYNEPIIGVDSNNSYKRKGKPRGKYKK